MSIPGYVATGLRLSGTLEDRAAVGPLVDELLVQGYLLGAGSWLAQLEREELDRFHERVVTVEGLIAEQQWLFLVEQLAALG